MATVDISGVLVACRPEHIDSVRGSLEPLDWADLHYVEDSGRMVVTIEARSPRQGIERLQQIKQLPHVLMAELVEVRGGIEEGMPA